MTNGVTHALTKDEVDNSRFYGVNFHRAAQMVSLSNDVKEKTGQSAVMSQTVDGLNGRIGISTGAKSGNRSSHQKSP